VKKVSLAILLLITITGCSPKPIELAVIRIKGSDTMLELTENLAEEYMKKQPGISIYVEGGGTSEGVRALIRGTADITTASRNLKPEEAKLLVEYYGTLGIVFLIAKDALSIYIHPDNPVKNLSIDQLKKIYQCEITNWKEVNGNDALIIPVTRNPNSGTQLYLQEHILDGEEYCEDLIIESTTRNVIEFISENPNAIGYGGISYNGKVHHLKIEGIEPSPKNAQNDSYPITRYLHFFTTKEPKGAVKNFIDWVLTPEGQKIVDQSGFIPLWEIPY
jgi:phosphate transport system substrate-binding protein